MSRQKEIQIKSKREQAIKWRKDRPSLLTSQVLHSRDGIVSTAVIGSNSNKEEMKTKPSCTLPVQKANPMVTKPNSTVSVPRTQRFRSTTAKPKAVPEIKHTLASKLRLIKANPLLEVRGIITLPDKYKKGLFKSYIRNKQENQMPASSFKKTNLQKSTNTKKDVSKVRSNMEQRAVSSTKSKFIPRRSLSADEHYKKPAVINEQKNLLKRNWSVTNIPGLEEEELEDGICPLPATPNIFETPGRRARYDAFLKSVATPSKIFTPAPEVMRKQLSEWLKKRGKSLVSFHHLHCFGLHANHKSRCFDKDFTPIRKYQRGSNLKSEPTSGKRTVLPKPCKDEIPNIVAVSEPPEDNKENLYEVNTTSPQDVLEDLMKVIQIGFPLDQCNHWLTAIRKSFPEVKEVPIYWECLAGLEEARGDFKSAVDCYERAIIRGASPNKVASSLDQLMEKFNLLNLQSDVNKEEGAKPCPRQVLDARNIFTSTIIKFALQQKAVRSLSTNLGMSASSLNYVVTPVRRSTRASTSRYSATPGVLCVKSLNNLEPNIRKSMVFKPNYALD